MEVLAKLKFLRISPRKVRLVANMVRGIAVDKALAILGFDPHYSARDIKKLIASAVANAKHNYHLDENNLFVKEIKVDMGPTFKRWFPRAHGKAAPLKRRTSHITVMLAERVARSGGSQKSKVTSKGESASGEKGQKVRGRQGGA